MTLLKTKIKRWLSAANQWRKSKGMNLALLVIILGVVQAYTDTLNSPYITMWIGLAVGIVRYLTTQSLDEK